MAEFDGIVQTPNLGLYKPDYNNVADIEVLDANFDILDEAIPEKLSHYLPLAGGKMSGTIQFNTGVAITAADNAKRIHLCGGSDYLSGAHIVLSGKDSTEAPSQFKIVAQKDANTVHGLTGGTDGMLSWTGNRIYSVGDFHSNASKEGFVHTHATSGAQMSFGVGESGTNRGIYEGVLNSGGYWLLNTDNGGDFAIRTKNGITLNGVTNGDLRWNTKKVVLEDNVATASTFGLMRAAAPADEINCNCDDAAITPEALYKLADYRMVNKAYKVGDIVGVPYHNELRLRCTAAGTTASTALNTTSATAGQTINDGSCRWLVEKISQVDSVNGMTGAVTINGVPVGTVLPFAGSSTPSGYVLCNGAAVSRTTYAALFAVIGTTYGAGNGSTTFNLPNYTDKFLQGHTTAGTSKSAGLPNITGFTASFPWTAENHGAWTQSSGGTAGPTGAFYTGGWARSGKKDGREGQSTYFDASRSNSIYGGSTTVQPPAVTVRFCIKY